MMDLFYCLTQDAHTLTDSEIEALLKFLIRECDRRLLDYQTVIDEAEQEIELEAQAELEECYDYIGVDKQGW